MKLTKITQVDNETPLSTLGLLKIGDMIINEQGIKGKIFATHHGENNGKFVFVFYFDNGDGLTQYAYSKKPL